MKGFISRLLGQGRIEYGDLQDDRMWFYDPKKELYGFVDQDKEIVIEAQYSSAGSFEQGYAVVGQRQDGQDYESCGVVDKQGHRIVPLKYMSVFPYPDMGVVAYTHDYEFFGLLDMAGHAVLDEASIVALDVLDEFIVVTKQHKNLDLQQGHFDIQTGEVEWNDNLDLINQRNRLYRELTEKAEIFLSDLYQKSCACAYPRIRHFVSLSDAHKSYEGEVIFEALKKHLHLDESAQGAGADEVFRCRVCGSVYEANFQQFNIEFAFWNVKIRQDEALEDEGAPVAHSIPWVLGFQWLETMEAADYSGYEQVETVQEFIDYLGASV